MDPYSSPFVIPNNSLHNPFPTKHQTGYAFQKQKSILVLPGCFKAQKPKATHFRRAAWWACSGSRSSESSPRPGAEKREDPIENPNIGFLILACTILGFLII